MNLELDCSSRRRKSGDMAALRANQGAYSRAIGAIAIVCLLALQMSSWGAKDIWPWLDSSVGLKHQVVANETYCGEALDGGAPSNKKHTHANCCILCSSSARVSNVFILVVLLGSVLGLGRDLTAGSVDVYEADSTRLLVSPTGAWRQRAPPMLPL
jgi:hypothetical protein